MTDHDAADWFRRQRRMFEELNAEEQQESVERQRMAEIERIAEAIYVQHCLKLDDDAEGSKRAVDEAFWRAQLFVEGRNARRTP